MANWAANLPEINGVFEAGISLGSDVQLADSKKLRLFPLEEIQQGDGAHERNLRLRAYKSALWAYRNEELGQGATKQFYVCGAFAVVYFGLMSRYMSPPRNDGDWVEVSSPGSFAEPNVGEQQALLAFLTHANVTRALTLIIATKANWYIMNHHTGQSLTQASGYTYKVLNVIVQNTGPEYITMAHTIGHWASTLMVLTKCNVTGIRTITPVIDHPVEFELSADARMRFSSNAAGTHLPTVCALAAKKLVNHDLVRYWHGTAELEAAIRGGITVKNLGARGHIGAQYLTGHPQGEVPMDAANAVRGRLGSFIRVMFGNSTLAKTPHFSETNVTSAEDFSPEWRTLCLANKSAAQRLYENMPAQDMTSMSEDDLINLRERIGQIQGN